MYRPRHFPRAECLVCPTRRVFKAGVCSGGRCDEHMLGAVAGMCLALWRRLRLVLWRACDWRCVGRMCERPQLHSGTSPASIA